MHEPWFELINNVDGIEVVFSRNYLTFFLAVRVPQLEVLPHWYWDEGVNLNVAWNLSLGRARMFAMQYPFVPHPPLFFLINAVVIRLFGLSLLACRGMSVLMGLISLFFF